MGTRILTPTPIAFYGENATVVTWLDLDATDTVGAALEMAGSSIRSVEISGTFDGATCVIEGSNGGSSYFTLTDPQGNALSKTAASIESVQESTRYMRPSISSAGANTSINVYMVLVRRGK